MSQIRVSDFSIPFVRFVETIHEDVAGFIGSLLEHTRGRLEGCRSSFGMYCRRGSKSAWQMNVLFQGFSDLLHVCPVSQVLCFVSPFVAHTTGWHTYLTPRRQRLPFSCRHAPMSSVGSHPSSPC